MAKIKCMDRKRINQRLKNNVEMWLMRVGFGVVILGGLALLGQCGKLMR
jgi:hypothetical protein